MAIYDKSLPCCLEVFEVGDCIQGHCGETCGLHTHFSKWCWKSLVFVGHQLDVGVSAELITNIHQIIFTYMKIFLIHTVHFVKTLPNVCYSHSLLNDKGTVLLKYSNLLKFYRFMEVPSNTQPHIHSCHGTQTSTYTQVIQTHTISMNYSQFILTVLCWHKTLCQFLAARFMTKVYVIGIFRGKKWLRAAFTDTAVTVIYGQTILTVPKDSKKQQQNINIWCIFLVQTQTLISVGRI